MKTKYKFIEFFEWTGMDGEKYWRCQNRRGKYLLANVAYHKKWKEWEFLPQPNMSFTIECINDISDFLSQLINQKSSPQGQKGEG